jgi:hypothetical protein
MLLAIGLLLEWLHQKGAVTLASAGPAVGKDIAASFKRLHLSKLRGDSLGARRFEPAATEDPVASALQQPAWNQLSKNHLPLRIHQ